MAGDESSGSGWAKVLSKAARTALCIALVLAAGLATALQAAPLGARLKLRWHGSTVSFIEAGRSHEVSIKEHFKAVELQRVTLQSARESGGFIYLLLDVTGPSKVPGDNHQCGAGSESNLIWLKLDQGWKATDAKDFLYDSCWSTVSMIDPPKWEGGTLRVETDNKVATYSYKRPEEGIKVAEAVVPK
jgi:hypothetical protein